MLNALRLPGFRWVATIYALDYMVELASSVALMVLVYDATDSALVAAAMLMCKQVVPGFLTAVLGKILDRVTVRQGLATAYLVFTGVLLALAATGYSVLLFVLAIVAGTTGAAVRALLRAAVARSTSGQDLREANAFLNVLMGVVALLGPAAGALIVSVAGTSTTLLVSAAGALALAITGAVLPATVGSAHMSEVEEEEGEGEEEPEGPRKSGVSVGGLLALGGLVVGLFAMDEPALLAYSEHALHAGIGGYGAILTTWGVGMIIGSLVYGKLLNRSMPMVFALGASINALGYVGLGIAPTIVFACTLAVIGGSGNGMLWVALVTAVQETAEEGEQGKMAARLEGIVTATPAIGLIIGGVIADVVAPRASLLIPGVIAFTAIAVWVVLQRGAARRPIATSGPSSPPVVPVAQMVPAGSPALSLSEGAA